jgi:hypothetical protein
VRGASESVCTRLVGRQTVAHTGGHLPLKGGPAGASCTRSGTNSGLAVRSCNLKFLRLGALSDFPSRSSKLSSRSLRLGNKELLHTTQLQTALYTKVSGTMRSLAGRCCYFSLKRSIDQHLLALVYVLAALAVDPTLTLISHVASIWCA